MFTGVFKANLLAVMLYDKAEPDVDADKSFVLYDCSVYVKGFPYVSVTLFDNSHVPLRATPAVLMFETLGVIIAGIEALFAYMFDILNTPVEGTFNALEYQLLTRARLLPNSVTMFEKLICPELTVGILKVLT
jgi:hypothetical protein